MITRKISLLTVSIILATTVCAWAPGSEASVRGTGIKTPRVNYISPTNESKIDLTGKEYLAFSWKPTPIPSGGRKAYRFSLFKGYEYDTVFDQELDPQTTSIDIPCSILEDNETYTWRVKQRDGGGWSPDLRWSFEAKK